MERNHRARASVQDAIGTLTIGAGYLVRDDGVAVALLNLTPPDLRLYDADALAHLLEAYTHILYACPDRCSLLTCAVPLDIHPLVHTLTHALDQAPDVRSYTVLGALSDWLHQTWGGLLHLRSVRWLLAVPSVAPETPPAGTWGELLPAAIVGHLTPLQGDPVAEVLSRAHRLLAQFATLGIEPGPTLLSAPEIRHLLRASLDPVATEDLPRRTIDAPRLLAVASGEGVS